ncbi:MAG: hypothetical protein V4592_03080 [Bacteroidota bacterium]
MKNFKQIAFGLIVGALAIGFSAFTNAKPSKAKFATTFYSLNQAGTTYTNAGTTDPSASCHAKPANPSCVISYASDQGETLDASDLPEGSTSVSSAGWINP